MKSSKALDEQRRPRGRRASGAALQRPTRAERVQAIRTLEHRGLGVPAIARELGLSPATVYDYRRDPEGTGVRERREARRGRCERCGESTHVHGGDDRPHAPRWCAACAPLARRRWSDYQLLGAIRDWTTLTGAAPTIYDWSPAHAPEGHPGAARYLAEARRWPNAGTVARRFGSMAAAVERAGVAAGEGR